MLLNRKQLRNIGDAKKLWFVKRGVRKVGGYEDDPVTINSTQPSLVEKHITEIPSTTVGLKIITIRATYVDIYNRLMTATTHLLALTLPSVGGEESLSQCIPKR